MNATQSNSKNVLNSDVDIKGTLKFSGELTFDGKLDGDISSEGTLNLGDNAVIKGNINATSVVVRGKVTGNVIAREKIDIKARTELFGDIKAPRLPPAQPATLVRNTAANPNNPTPTTNGSPHRPPAAP